MKKQKERKLVRIVHYYDDGSYATLEGDGIEAYQYNMTTAATLVMSHKANVMKEDWKESKKNA